MLTTIHIVVNWRINAKLSLLGSYSNTKYSHPGKDLHLGCRQSFPSPLSNTISYTAPSVVF